MEAKKISFGFSKTNKKSNLLPTKANIKTETKVELIKCLEAQKIKLLEEKPEETPLIIQLKEAQKTSAALASLMKRRAVLLGEEELEDNIDKSEDPPKSLNNEGPEDIEKRAAREILAEIKRNGSSDPGNDLVLPVVKPEDLILEGAKESSLDDYESIPIQDFGKAMLRGMGWTEPLQKPNKKGGAPSDEIPAARPKGMGLGADKALSKKNPLVAPEANEKLEIKRNAYVLILGGKYKDLYGQIEGFDDHAGRVIVKMAIGGAKEVFNEFLCQPVSRKEYAQYGKCINSSKYDEYKKKENEYGQIVLDKPDKDFIEKNKANTKKEHDDSVGIKYEKTNDEYKRIHKYEDYKEVKRSIKTDGDNIRDNESDRKRAYDKNDSKNYMKIEDKDRKYGQTSIEYIKDSKRESNRNDARNSRRECSDASYKNEYTNREHDAYESKSNYSRDYENTNYSKDLCRSSNSFRDTQCKNDRDQYDSTDSENYSYISEHKKSEKTHSKKKSKKSKKSKSKHRQNSSDSEPTSSTDSEEDKRKKHKKKTKKSKKQRERSRSRIRK